MKSLKYVWLAAACATTVAAAGAAMSAGGFSGAPAKLLRQSASPVKEELITRLIIKPRQQAGKDLGNALKAKNNEALSKVTKVRMSVFRPMADDAHVVRLETPVTLSEAKVIAARLVREGGAELVEPDRIVRTFTSPPNDPGYQQQWHYYAPGGANLGGADLPRAWDVTIGSEHVTVAVIDTGVRPHVDLGPVLPGFDFIGDTSISNDGNGRDADASDPGDAVAAGECGAGEPASPSSWHGTHVAGTIAALMNNNIGVAGIAPRVHILPVRVLGKCGGYISDIVDGMRWAAGLPVTGMPANPYPAQVLNLSLGASGSCSRLFQNAVSAITGAGSVIVAAAGNDGASAVSQPANCSGVIAVTAHAIDGDNAYYANVGPEIAISAPGGGCGTASSTGAYCNYSVNGLSVLSLGNSGTASPGADTYTSYMGTSMATPHVAGVAALLMSAYSYTPAQVRSRLLSTARPHPASSTCQSVYPGECGAGLLDAANALSSPDTPAVSIANPMQVVAPNAVVSLAGTATDDGTITGYSWNQVTGAPVGAISNANSASASFTAGTTGTVSFELTATDDAGMSGKAIAIVRVNSAPVLTAVANQAFAAGATASFQVGATDADGDPVLFHGLSLPAGATLSAQGAFSWPNAPAGTYTMAYYANDGYADSAPGTVTITIAPASTGSGGGGSMGGDSLLLLAALAAARRARRILVRR